ncbi:hypothetical protein Vadar_032547 [Vaccinium darrowii]|uniref:Uncharacterized protein n=1 Tax=Vaccinium darrowii TaxID=229202 RepID=A0ACB7X5Q0_9ERIC|nr:hypothetical protein Vadar_032547 [Vaccinium darrowii]
MADEEKLLKEAEDLPWKDRLMHENPNVRRQANIDLAVIFSAADAQDPEPTASGPFFKDTIADSNASVQMVALKALTAYLNHVDSGVALRYAAEIYDAIIANCMTGGPEMVEKSQAVFMRWVQLGAMEVFLDAVEKALKNKLFEAVVPMIDTMGKALRIFGAMKVPTKRILKMMAELFDHEDVNVRTSSKVLTLELYEGIEIEPMKSMEKDLEGELVSLTGTPGPSHRIRSEEDNELEREGVSEVEGGSGSKESVTDAPLAIDDAVKILDNWKNKKFGDGMKAAELAKLALTDGMAPGDFKEIRSTLKEIMTCVVEHFGLRTTFVVEEGLDGFHIQSNNRSIPKKPITFNIHTPGEGAMIGKFLHHMGELIGWYNFIIGEEHLSMLIVPRIPSTPVIEEFKAWGESDVFMLDPLTT